MKEDKPAILEQSWLLDKPLWKNEVKKNIANNKLF